MRYSARRKKIRVCYSVRRKKIQGTQERNLFCLHLLISVVIFSIEKTNIIIKLKIRVKYGGLLF
jgi:hypothetical protein